VEINCPLMPQITADFYKPFSAENVRHQRENIKGKNAGKPKSSYRKGNPSFNPQQLFAGVLLHLENAGGISRGHQFF
jgi:hypothetical protein